MVLDVTIVPDHGWQFLCLRARGFAPALFTNGLAELAKPARDVGLHHNVQRYWGWFRPYGAGICTGW